MRQPVRDERWLDPQGEAWQVATVGKWRTETTKKAKGRKGRAIPTGPYTVSYYLMRHVSGIEARINPADVVNWTRESKDPLEGQRNRISTEIRNGARLIVLPAPGMNPVCPVRKGELYHLTCGPILIERVARRLVKERDAEWHISFIRLVTERDYFMRRTPPNTGERDESKTDQQTRIESSYTGNASKSIDDLSTVPPDWEDRGVAVRELTRQTDRQEQERERQAQAAKSRLNRLLKNAKNPEEAQRLLAGIVALCEQVEEQKAA